MRKANDYIKKKMPHLLPNLEEWPINILSERRDAFIEKVVEETVHVFVEEEGQLMDELQNAARLEARRIKNDPWSVDPPNQKAFWNSISKSLRAVENLPEGNEQRHALSVDALTRIVKVYAEEIAGRFKPSIFKGARIFCASFFSVLFNRFRRGKFGFWGGRKHLADKMRVVGPTKHIRKLFETGTLVIVPTHSSNLDSLLVGYALDYYAGLPSSHYGAGLNLFNSEIAGYFMNRLGAYRVDRRKKNKIYLETLKSASRIAIELGVNSLFFPGGTRSRSGELEQNLKLGLLSTVVQAQRLLFQEKIDKKIFVVPLVISYPNVLEDRMLYGNFLHRQGLSNQVRKKLKAKNPILRVFSLFGKLFTNEMVTYLSFGEPMDVFGNYVDDQGHSLDKQGKRISKREYFLQNGLVSEDHQRESVYTRHLADLIAESYRKHYVVRLSNLCAAALLQGIQQENRISTLEATMKLARVEWTISNELFVKKFESLVAKFRRFESQELCLIEDLLLNDTDTQVLINEGIKQLRTYQMYSVIVLKNEEVNTDHIGLLCYYANRLECYFAYERQQ